MINKEIYAKLEASKDVRLYICGKSFKYFVVYYFIEYLKSPFSPFHEDFFTNFEKLAEGELTDLALFGFRGCTKTVYTRLFALWCICFGKKRFITYDSHTKENAELALFNIAIELQTNPRIIEDFGQLFFEDKQKKKQKETTKKQISDFITEPNPINGIKTKCEAFSTTKSPRGRVLPGGYRPDLMLNDDFETEETIESEKVTAKTKAHLNTQRTGGQQGKASVVYLGNYLSEDGVVNYIANRLERMGKKGKCLWIPIIKDGKPTWPARYVMTDTELLDPANKGKVSIETLKRDNGSKVFAGEFMNNPYPDDAKLFKRGMFKYDRLEDVLKRPYTAYMTVDTATAKGGDYTGIVINFVQGGKWKIFSFRGKYTPSEFFDLVFEYYNRFNLARIGIERTMYTTALEESFITEQKRRNQKLPIIDLKHGGTKKEKRIEQLLPRYERGEIVHIDLFCDTLEGELLRFPNAKNDDISDALAYMAMMLKGRTTTEEEENYDYRQHKKKQKKAPRNVRDRFDRR